MNQALPRPRWRSVAQLRRRCRGLGEVVTADGVIAMIKAASTGAEHLLGAQPTGGGWPPWRASSKLQQGGWWLAIGE
jgi:hypothetical protein